MTNMNSFNNEDGQLSMKGRGTVRTVLKAAVVLGVIGGGAYFFLNKNNVTLATLDQVASIEPAAGGAVEDPLAWDPNKAPSPEAVPAAAETPAMPPPPDTTAAVPVETLAAPAAETAPAPVAEKTEAPASPAPVSGDAARLDQLEQRMTVLEQSMAEMGRAVATKADIESLRAGLERGPAVQADEKPRTVTPKKQHKPVVKKEAPAPQWILKSAKPGEAWLAQKGSHELKMIAIGDTVPGLGKITTIGRDSTGQWIVNGTKGRISQ